MNKRLIILLFILWQIVQISALGRGITSTDIDTNKIPPDNWVSFGYSESDYQNAMSKTSNSEIKNAYGIIRGYATNQADGYNVNFNLINSIIKVESSWNFNIPPSESGAKGLMQLKNDPVNDIKEKTGICYDYCGKREIDVNSLDDNIFGGICYLSCQYYHDSRLRGCKSLNIALAAYKQGPSEVSKLCGKDSDAQCDFTKCYSLLNYETKRYIWKVKNAYDEIVSGKLKVVIDAGHGGNKPGAVGPLGKKEKDITLLIAKELENVLKSNKNVEVQMTRVDDSSVSLYQRVKKANDWGANVFVSVHANSAPKRYIDFVGRCPLQSGTETYYYTSSSKGQEIAKNVQRELINALGTKDRGILGTKGLYVLRNTKKGVYAIIVEPGFICNPDDLKMLSDSKKQKQIAQAIADGILKSFA